jgi:hypothetical protein
MNERNDNQEIVVQIKQVYGNDTVYPICTQAKLFAELLGQKTLTFTDLNIIKRLGFAVTQQPYQLKGQPQT